MTAITVTTRITELHSERGQALIEFCLGSFIAGIALVGSGLILRAEFNRAQCAYAVFEKTHAALIGGMDPLPLFHAVIQREPNVVGRALCGRAHEEVALPEIESGPW